MKRMYANEELVKLIQENAPETEVDDALSNTSENPVQNKVIYGALEDKQDALPDTTGQTDKFLKVGADGLEWASAGGGQKYLHCINYKYYDSTNKSDVTMYISLINDSSTPIDKDHLGSSIRELGYISASNALSCIGYGHGITDNNGTVTYRTIFLKKCWCASSNSLVGFCDILANALDLTAQTLTLTKNEDSTYSFVLGASAVVLDSVFPL